MKYCHTSVMGQIVFVSALTGCASIPDKEQAQPIMPPNAESEYLKTVAVGISLDGDVTPTKIVYNQI